MTEKSEKLVKGKIDGIEICVPQGTTILEAAKTVGIEIPHFCYHPGIGVEGSCRMCLVEIKGNPKLQVSCAIPFTEGIEVITDSDAVLKAREGVLEFILINHPLDCPICDKGGECPLQDYSFKHGTGKSRFDLEKRKLVKHKILGDNIIFDSERCILCTRCARFYRDITGTFELIVEKRGHKSEIKAFRDRPLKNIFSGNLADICPVGALTTRDFRFTARPWEMKTYDSACSLCGLNCSIQIWKKRRKHINKLYRVTPAHNERVNDWWLCDKGRFGWKNLIEKERVTTSFIRDNDSLKEINSKEASEELTGILEDLFKRVGKESLKIISSTDITNEEAWLLRNIADASEKRGTVVFPVSKVAAEFHRFLKEKNLLTRDFTEVEKSKALVFLGTDIVLTHPVVYLMVRKTVLKNATKIFATHDFKFPEETIVEKRLKDAGKKPSEVLEALKKEISGCKDITLFADGNWVSKDNLDALKAFIEELKKEGVLNNVVALRNGDHNTFGILDTASSYYGYKEEIHSILVEGSAKEIILIGDDVIRDFVGHSDYKASNYNFICMIKKFKDKDMDDAHVIFPQRGFLEKNGTMTNVFGTTQKLTKVIAASGNSLEEWKILLSLVTLFGRDLSYLDENEIYSEIAGYMKEYPKSINDIKWADAVYTHYNRELRK